MTVTASAATGEIRELPVHRAFERWARERPAAVAVSHGPVSWGYGELNSRANRLARLLRASGAGPETVVGVCLDRSPGYVAAELAILKAGAAFLPLDPGTPTVRLEALARDSGAAVLIYQGRPLRTGARSLDLGTAAGQLAACEDGDLGGDTPGHRLAYVIYTSGSTGNPKGVPVEHGQLSTILAAVQDLLQLSAGSRCLQSTSFTFDMSVAVTFATLGSGGTLVLADQPDSADPDRLARLLREQRVDTLVLPPSVLVPLRDEALAGLRTVCVGGETCSVSLARRAGAGRRFLNAYGPTETTIVATIHVAAPDGEEPPDPVPIGAPLPGVRAYVLDGAGDLVEPGEVGEIYLGGAGVTRGYLGMPGATAERFLPDPWAGPPGARMYRTGDLGRQLPTGELQFRGRTDHQVKVRGYRIELGEIERALEAHPQVRQAVVVVRGVPPAELRLCAFVTLTGPGASVKLREFLGERLPQYLVPHQVVTVSAFPLTASGKVDRAALAELAVAPAAPGHYLPPRTPTEQTIAEVWALVLGLPRVSRHDSFTALGGDSLAAGKIASRMRGLIGVEVPLQALFEQGMTVEGLAAAVDSGTFTASSSPVSRIPRRVRAR